MTDEQLKSALIEVRDYMLIQFPSEDGDHEFSRRFLKKMKQLIKLEMHPLLFYAKRIVAAILIIICVSGCLVLGFSEDVRADAIRWFMEHFAENGYRYQKEAEVAIDLTRYTLEGIVLDGYQLIDRTEKEDVVDEAYVGEDGSLLVFTAMNSSKQKEFNVSSDQSMVIETVYVNGNKADLYLSENPYESNVIVWEGSNGVLFSLGGILDKEQLISMAEKIE